MSKAVFLDRDGVINVDSGYVHSKEKFIFIENIFDLCLHLQNLGYLLIVITNQSGIDRGYYTEETFNQLSKWMTDTFKKNHIEISKVYYCPDTPEKATFMRKPNPGMILNAKEEFDIDLDKSWLIGDKLTDIEAGENAKINNLILFQESSALHKKDKERYHITCSLNEIKNIISR
ncbi:D-glycero-beta-D-manno-heptose-1,7-bisphosphate 7-phosphatase [Candidatus Marinamargulisbacteria bacterium SCGC AAA071-K20]|nr:D-glycero-beta-D-manno-heptose-1,7-bisphosphate 7-phosphatase [Candidatus Marinamargulisbacteria bacterium SCGC AAA071-K20]